MEQESEGQAKMSPLDFERKVRLEALSVCQRLEQRIRDAPEGFLGIAHGEETQEILNAFATTVETFGKLIRMLSAYPNGSRNAAFPITAEDTKSQEQIGRVGAMPLNAESPLLSTTNTAESTPPHSPRRPPGSTSSRLIMSSPNISPCHTPLSGSGMSDGSPRRQNAVALDSDGEVADRVRRSTNTSNSAEMEPNEKQALSKKRKYLPKYSCKQLATGSDPGNDGPPDDGYTWRKYGQKDILNSSYPRSYYRCTHKHDLGCPSTKLVQRSDKDPTMFDVTYRGDHICPSMQQRTNWPFAVAPSQMAIHELLNSDPNISNAIMAATIGNLRTNIPSQSQENVLLGISPAAQSTAGLAVPHSSASDMKQTHPTTAPAPALNQTLAGGFFLEGHPMAVSRGSGTHRCSISPNSASANQSSQQSFQARTTATDGICRAESFLMNLVLGTSPQTVQRTDGRGSTAFDDLSDYGQLHSQKDTEAEREDGGQARTRSVNNIEVMRSLERWPDPLESQFSVSSHQAVHDELTGVYCVSPSNSEVLSNQQQEVRCPYNNLPPMESDASEVISEQTPLPGSPYSPMAGYMIGSPGCHPHMYVDIDQPW